MSTFDGSTTPVTDEWPQRPPEPARPFDALDMLREQVDTREQEYERVTRVPVPGIGWRLVCAIDFEYGQYKDWQKAALPRNQRNGRKVNPLDINQAVLCQHVLINTCEGLEYQRTDGEWESLVDDNGEPMTLVTSNLLSRFNVIDPKTLVRTLFGGDAATIKAGTQVATEAGYAQGDDTDSESDPLD